jgi:hypothetical protein
MDYKKGQQIYNKTSGAFLKAHKIKERLEVLNTNVSFPPTQEQCEEYEAIDKIRMQARRKGIKQCRRVYRSGIASSPALKKAQLCVRVIDLLIKRRTTESKIKWKTITKLAKKVGKEVYTEYSIDRLWTERREQRKKYYDLKNKSGKLRSTFIEEKAKEAEAKGDKDEAQRLHNMLSNEKKRERAAQLRRVKAQELRTGVRSVKKARLVFDPGGNQVLDNDGNPLYILEEITEKSKLEEACMEEVGQRSRMSEDSPPMSHPLVDHLLYSGINTFSDDILLGKTQSFPEIDSYTEAYLKQLVSVSGYLPDKAEAIPFPEYIQEVKRLQEKTSSGPSDVTPAMIKTKALDPYLSEVG